MTTTHGSSEFSPDEEAYLWAVARRSQMKVKLEDDAMRHLLESGVLKIHDDWPTLTERGKHYLESRATDLWSEIIKHNV